MFVTAQTTIKVTSNLTADYATNTTSWVVDDPATNLPILGATLKAAYDLWRPQMSDLVPAAGHYTKFYDREDPTPRAPILNYGWSLAATPSSSALPSELAVCCSFQGDPMSGQPQARRRGRNYLPFLGTVAIGAAGRLQATAITAAVAWGDHLLEFSKANAACTWVVASSFGVPGEFDTIITNGWVDNEADIQRRRGRDATSRTIFS